VAFGDKITKDIPYVLPNPTDSEIKLAMLDSGKTINLPVNNKAELDIIKAQITEMPSFEECLELYDSIKSVTDIA
jgi:hypothetical protein